LLRESICSDWNIIFITNLIPEGINSTEILRGLFIINYLVSYVVNVGKKKICPLRRAMWSIVQHVLFPQNMVIL
jgi:hypothetical protein